MQQPGRLIYARLWYSIAFAMLLLVALVSLMPAPDMGTSDKLLHFITYFLLSAGFTILNRLSANLALIAIGLVVYGIVLEFLQGLTGYRMMDVNDMLANSAGVMAGLLIWLTPLPGWFRTLEGRIRDWKSMSS